MFGSGKAHVVAVAAFLSAALAAGALPDASHAADNGGPKERLVSLGDATSVLYSFSQTTENQARWEDTSQKKVVKKTKDGSSKNFVTTDHFNRTFKTHMVYTTTTTATKVTLDIDVYLTADWANFNLQSTTGANKLWSMKFDATDKSATKKKLSLSLKKNQSTYVSKGNKIKVGSHTFSWDRGSKNKKKSFYAAVTRKSCNRTSKAKASITVPALEKRTLTMKNLASGTKTTKFTAKSGNITLNTPGAADTPAGKKFAGWYSDKTGGTKVSAVAAAANKNVTVWARWEPIAIEKSQETQPKQEKPKEQAKKVQSQKLEEPKKPAQQAPQEKPKQEQQAQQEKPKQEQQVQQPASQQADQQPASPEPAGNNAPSGTAPASDEPFFDPDLTASTVKAEAVNATAGESAAGNGAEAAGQPDASGQQPQGQPTASPITLRPGGTGMTDEEKDFLSKLAGENAMDGSGTLPSSETPSTPSGGDDSQQGAAAPSVSAPSLSVTVDGKPFEGFDPTVANYSLDEAATHEITFSGYDPAEMSAETSSAPGMLVFTFSDGARSASYTFAWQVPADESGFSDDSSEPAAGVATGESGAEGDDGAGASASGNAPAADGQDRFAGVEFYVNGTPAGPRDGSPIGEVPGNASSVKTFVVEEGVRGGQNSLSFDGVPEGVEPEIDTVMARNKQGRYALVHQVRMPDGDSVRYFEVLQILAEEQEAPAVAETLQADDDRQAEGLVTAEVVSDDDAGEWTASEGGDALVSGPGLVSEEAAVQAPVPAQPASAPAPVLPIGLALIGIAAAFGAVAVRLRHKVS